MRLRRLVLLFWLLPACGGGGGGGGPPDPPPTPYADLLESGLALAAAFPDAAAIGQRVLYPVSEIEMQADLNGDGDMLDRVVHELDVATDTTANLGLAVVGTILTSNLHLAFLVPEAGQGGTDLNGDGDTGDAVWYVYVPGAAAGVGTRINTAVATPATGLGGAGTRGGFVLLESETAQAADLNGDGDMLDVVGALFDGATLTVSPVIAGPQAPATPLVARNGRVLMAVAEAAAGATDLNGDGDATDIVLHVVDFNLGTPTFTRIGFPSGRAVANHPYALTDNAAVYFIDEMANGAIDFNLDGDTTDAILAVFDIAGGTGEATPITPALPTLAVAGDPQRGLGAGQARVLVGVSETANGATDLNADGDSTDSLLGWIDTTPGNQFTLNLVLLPLAQRPLRVDGTRGLFAVTEFGIGFTGADLNGDADANDSVLHMIDTVTNTTINLGVAIGSIDLAGTDAFVGVTEAAQGGTDLNGDTDTGDTVLSYFDLSDALPAERRLGVVAWSLTMFRLSPTELRVAMLMPEGQSANFNDLNNDGDTLDNFVELFAFDPTQSPPGPLTKTPFFAGIASLGTTAPLRAGNDVFVFPGAEVSAGADLNADGDQFDTALRYCRIR